MWPVKWTCTISDLIENYGIFGNIKSNFPQCVGLMITFIFKPLFNITLVHISVLFETRHNKILFKLNK